jgi:Mg2+ and Co2+ transporter CorA
MVYFNLNQYNIDYNLNPSDFSSDLIKNNHVLLCNSIEFTSIFKKYNFDDHSIIKTDNLDETVRYTNYRDYHFISIVFINSNMKTNEINIYFTNDYFVICVEKNNESEIDKVTDAFVKNLSNLVRNKMPKHNMAISSAIFNIFDTYIFYSVKIMEEIEDSLEKLQDEILQEIQANHMNLINEYRKKAYLLKKHYRALLNISFFYENTKESTYINEYFMVFEKLSKRIKGLINFSESLYNLSGEIMKIYDSKNNNKTNILITRLTVFTIIMGV